MNRKISKQTPNNEIKNTKLFCKHNQNKTKFLINLDKIGLILGLLQVLLGLIFGLVVVYLSEYKDKSSFNGYSYKKSIVFFFWFFMVITALFIIKSACKIKLIKNHEPTEENCQKIEHNIQQAIKSFKKNMKIIIYLWFIIISLIIPISLSNIFWSTSSKPIIFKFLTPIILFCYFFIGLSCVLFIRKPKK